MNVLWHWVPTFTAIAILVVVGFILLAQIRREERKAQQEGKDKPRSDTAGA